MEIFIKLTITWENGVLVGRHELIIGDLYQFFTKLWSILDVRYVHINFFISYFDFNKCYKKKCFYFVISALLICMATITCPLHYNHLVFYCCCAENFVMFFSLTTPGKLHIQMQICIHMHVQWQLPTVFFTLRSFALRLTLLSFIPKERSSHTSLFLLYKNKQNIYSNFG